MRGSVFVRIIVLGAILAGCGGKEAAVIKNSNDLLSQRKYVEASLVLEKAIREDPKNKNLLRQRVLLFLKIEQPGYAIAAYRNLQDVSPKDPVLYKAIENKDPVIRVTAVHALGLIKDPEAIAPLIKVAKDPEQSVRLAVVQALGDLKDRKAIPVLVNFLNDSDWFVRGEAAFALGKIGDAQAAAALFKLLDDPDNYVRKNVRKALEQLANEENKSAYLDALNSPDVPIQTMAAVALANLGGKDGMKVLLAQLDNSNNKDLPDVIGALVKTKDDAALPGLRRAVNHPDPDVKIRAILALGEYQDKNSVEMLKNIAKDKNTDGDIRTACLIALNKIAAGN